MCFTVQKISVYAYNVSKFSKCNVCAFYSVKVLIDNDVSINGICTYVLVCVLPIHMGKSMIIT